MGVELFLACAFIFGLIRLFAFLTPAMPLWLFLSFDLVFAAPIALVAIHAAAVRRTRLAHTFSDSGVVHGILAHGFFRNIFIFFFSVLISFALLINLALVRGEDWIWVGLAFPVFFLARALVPKFLVRESVAWLRPARLNFWSLGLAPVIIGAARFGYFTLFGEGPDLLAAGEAPFVHSNSAFLKMAGEWAAMFGTWGQRSLRLAQDFFRPLGPLFQTLNSFCLYGGFLSLLACLTLPAGEWRRGFSPPVETESPPKLSTQATVAYSAFLAIFLVMVMIPLAGWLETNAAGPKGAALQETRVKLSDRGDQVFLFLEGHYYDPKAAEEIKRISEALLGHIKVDREALMAQANLLFNQYRDNVDRYLDWYYSLRGEYARLYKVIRGSAAGAERYMAEKMVELIGYNVDAGPFMAGAARLEEKMAAFKGRLEAMAQRILPHYEVPAALAAKAKIQSITMESLVFSVAPVETISFGKRIGLSGVAGLSSGAVAMVLVAKIGQKAIFKMAAGALAKMAASKGVTAAGGLAAGAGVGSVVPGAGTAVGAGVGFLVGAAVGLVVEKVILNVEEMVNRAEFKLEILKAIQSQRLEVLNSLRSAIPEERPVEAAPKP
ncbi:MAG: hypothetical protein LBE01_01195 [Deltaproteobacteria bacterium]|jgi:hypothetical protein|nr:hypothetical protein [Deltaproteobacteria bacterium]